MRVLHAAAHKVTWYGQWGYQYGRGAFNITQNKYAFAARVILAQLAKLCSMISFMTTPVIPVAICVVTLVDRFLLTQAKASAYVCIRQLYDSCSAINCRCWPTVRITAIFRPGVKHLSVNSCFDIAQVVCWHLFGGSHGGWQSYAALPTLLFVRTLPWKCCVEGVDRF